MILSDDLNFDFGIFQSEKGFLNDFPDPWITKWWPKFGCSGIDSFFDKIDRTGWLVIIKRWDHKKTNVSEDFSFYEREMIVAVPFLPIHGLL